MRAQTERGEFVALYFDALERLDDERAAYDEASTTWQRRHGFKLYASRASFRVALRRELDKLREQVEAVR